MAPLTVFLDANVLYPPYFWDFIYIWQLTMFLEIDGPSRFTRNGDSHSFVTVPTYLTNWNALVESPIVQILIQSPTVYIVQNYI